MRSRIEGGAFTVFKIVLKDPLYATSGPFLYSSIGKRTGFISAGVELKLELTFCESITSADQSRRNAGAWFRHTYRWKSKECCKQLFYCVSALNNCELTFWGTFYKRHCFPVSLPDQRRHAWRFSWWFWRKDRCSTGVDQWYIRRLVFPQTTRLPDLCRVCCNQQRARDQ